MTLSSRFTKAYLYDVPEGGVSSNASKKLECMNKLSPTIEFHSTTTSLIKSKIDIEYPDIGKLKSLEVMDLLKVQEYINEKFVIFVTNITMYKRHLIVNVTLINI